jgi:uncharacterized protein YjiS (DUF1127 family)
MTLLDLCNRPISALAEETIMFRSWINRYRQWRLERQAIAMLHSFDDHRLADVGTFRDSIELFVAARVRRQSHEESYS